VKDFFDIKQISGLIMWYSLCRMNRLGLARSWEKVTTKLGKQSTSAIPDVQYDQLFQLSSGHIEAEERGLFCCKRRRQSRANHSIVRGFEAVCRRQQGADIRSSSSTTGSP
jgi:hypothetical protein